MFKFSKFGKIGIALVLVLMTVLSTFSMVWAVLLPEGANGDNPMNSSGLLPFYYTTDTDAGWWYWTRSNTNVVNTKQHSTTYVRKNVINGNVINDNGTTSTPSPGTDNVQTTRLKPKGITNNDDWLKRTYIRQWMSYDFTMDINPAGVASGWSPFKGASAKSKVYYNQTIDKTSGSSFMKNTDTVVPGWTSGGTNSIFGGQFDGEFTNVAQCVVQPASSEKNDITIARLSDTTLYGINNESTRAKTFYYLTPQMTKGKTGSSESDYFAVQKMAESDVITRKEVSTIGSKDVLTDEQLQVYKAILYEKFYRLYTTKYNVGRAQLVMNELDPTKQYALVSGSHNLHVLGHYEDDKYVVTYEDLLHFISFAFYLTNDICDDRDDVRAGLASGGWLKTWIDANERTGIGGYNTNTWGFVHDTTPCNNVYIQGDNNAHGSGSNIYNNNLVGVSDYSHERFNQNTIFQLEHAFMSWLSIGDKTGNNGHDGGWYYSSPNYKDPGRDVDAWGGGYLLDILPVHYILRTSSEVDADGYNRGSAKYIAEQSREKEVMKDIWITLFYQLEEGNNPSYTVRHLNGDPEHVVGATYNGPFMSAIPSEVVVFYYYPTNPDKDKGRIAPVDKSNGSNYNDEKPFGHSNNTHPDMQGGTYANPSGIGDYTQIYVSSAILRTPVIIHKEADFNEVSTEDHYEYYQDYSPIRLKLYESVDSLGHVQDEVKLGDESGDTSNGKAWDTMVPDEWLDKQNNAIKFTEREDEDGKKIWVAGLYLMRWGGYKSGAARAGRQYDAPYYLQEFDTVDGQTSSSSSFTMNLRVKTFDDSFYPGSVQNVGGNSNTVQFQIWKGSFNYSNELTLQNDARTTSLEFRKQEVDENGTSLGFLYGAKFTLYERKEFYDLVKSTGAAPTDTQLNAKKNSISGSVDGFVNFTNVLYGDYILIEREKPKNNNGTENPNYSLTYSPYSLDNIVEDVKNSADYDAFNKIDASHVYNLSVTDAHMVKRYDKTSGVVENDSSFRIDNTKVGIISIDKTGAPNSAPLAGAEFKLYNTRPVDGVAHVREGTTDSNGHLEFIDLPLGTYYLVETKAPQGYDIASDFKRANVAASGYSGDGEIVLSSASGGTQTVNVSIQDPVAKSGIKLHKVLLTSDASDDGSITLYEVPNGLEPDIITNPTIREKYSYDSVSFTFYKTLQGAQQQNNSDILTCISVNDDTTITQAKDLKLDSSGNLQINFNKANPGTAETYYFRETFDDGSHLHPMNNAETDMDDNNKSKVYSVTISANDTEVSIDHKNYVDRGTFLSFRKVNNQRVSVPGGKELISGGIFKIEFFDEKFTSESQIGNTEPALVYYVSADGRELYQYSTNHKLYGYYPPQHVVGPGVQYANENNYQNDIMWNRISSTTGNAKCRLIYGAYCPEGCYRLTEIEPPEGYAISKETYFGTLTGNETGVTYVGTKKTSGVAYIDENGDSHTASSSDPIYVIDNIPYASITITKQDVNTNAYLADAIFKLEYWDTKYPASSGGPPSSEAPYVYYVQSDASGRIDTTDSSVYLPYSVNAANITTKGSPVYKGTFKRDGTYRITEIQAPSGYMLSTTINGVPNSGNSTHGTFNKTGDITVGFKNPPIPSITVEGSKIWDDVHNFDGTRPTAIRVELYQNGNQYSSAILGNTRVNSSTNELEVDRTYYRTADTGDSLFDYEFTGLPEGYYDDNHVYHQYEYSVNEVMLTCSDSVSGQWIPISEFSEYTDSGYTVLYQNSRAVMTVDGNDVYNQAIGNVATKRATGTVNSNNGVDWTVSDVPSGTTPLQVDIRNTKRPPDTSVTIKKDWADNNNQYQTRPSSIQVNLYRKWDASQWALSNHPTDGELSELVNTYTISASEGWQKTIPHLDSIASSLNNHTPSVDLGTYFDTTYTNSDWYINTPFTYYVEEVSVPGYSTEKSGDLTLVNYEMKNIIIEKQWDDEDDLWGKRPQSVNFTLFREYTVPGYYTSDSQSKTITKTVGTYTINSFNNNVGSVTVANQPIVASAFFGDDITVDLGNLIGTDAATGQAFTKYETIGANAIPCRYYVTESAVAGYDAPEYLTHTEAVVQGVLTETIPVKNTLKLFDVVINKYLRTGEPGNGNTLEARLQGTTRARNGTFVLGKGNGNGGVLYSTALSSGIYEAQGFELLGTANETRNYFRVRGGTASTPSYINSKFPSTPLDENGENYNTFSSRYYMSVGNRNATVQGQLRIKNLEPGEYVLLEIIPPTGNYSTAYKPFSFTLLDDGRIRYSAGGAAQFMDEINVIDDKIYVPKTGAEGYMLYYITAALLVLSLSVFGVLFFRRRRIRSSIVK